MARQSHGLPCALAKLLETRLPVRGDVRVDGRRYHRSARRFRFFARFRGLKSWRSSPWHPKENLPAEYGRVYHFEQWAALQKHALREQAEAADDCPESHAMPGSYVRIALTVPHAFAARYGLCGGPRKDAPGESTLVVCGVNTYEDHLSVLHFALTLSGPACLGESGVFDEYEFEGEKEDVLANLYQFHLAVQIYSCLLENVTSEMASKMTAMDSATTNATDMIGRLTIVYNRRRQAKVTTELTEIVAGAEAV